MSQSDAFDPAAFARDVDAHKVCPSCGHAVRFNPQFGPDYEPIGCFQIVDDHQVCDEQLAALAWAGDDLIDVLVAHPGTRAADEAITAWRKLAKASRTVPGA